MKYTRAINHKSPPKDCAAFKILVGGIFGMIVAMGVGRFAFTPILPLMQRDLGMTNTVAGWLAGLNYLGYLAGAIFCTFASQWLRSRILGAGALLLSLGTTISMGLTLSPIWWGYMRLASGVASAILFIIISAEVGELLARSGYGHWFGALYGGIGLGIVLSGLIIPQLDRVGGWSTAWTGIGLFAVICAVIGMAFGRTENYSPPIASEETPLNGRLHSICLLAIAYFLEGLGYIVTATFLVAIVAATPSLQTFASFSWVVVGFAAVPSTIIWPHLARCIGNKQSLMAAYVIQFAGILASRDATSLTEVLFAAVCFGGTFLGIAALILAEGRLRMGKDGRRAAAFLTVSFSAGQMFGPIIAGMLADRQDGFALPLLLAAASVALGGLFIAADGHYQ